MNAPLGNAQIAAMFEEVADLLELQGANAFRVRAYRRAAATLHDLTIAVEEVPAAELSDLPGIGKDLAAKIRTLLDTGSLPLRDELRQEIPPGVLALTRLPGVGPKKAGTLFRELGVTSPEELEAAAKAGRVANLKGFGAKTQSAMLTALAARQTTPLRELRSVAALAAEPILASLRGHPLTTRADLAGSYRRCKETVGDLDLLVAVANPATDAEPIMEALAAQSLVETTLQRGPTKMRVRLRTGLELDVRVLAEGDYGAALIYFTGSQAHNIALRKRAQERGWKLSEYGLFDGETRIASRTEEDVHAALELAWIPPELREDRGELDRAAAGTLPRLVTVADLRGDLHCHTTATDGAATIEHMAAAARALGHEYLAITDHSQRVSVARGLNAERLLAHWREIDRVNDQLTGFTLLKGIECDILEEARMDLPDEVLAQADWVVAVLHYGLRQPGEQIMKRLRLALEHPHVDAIGHPSGRLIGRREAAAIDWPEFMSLAAETGTLLEINCGADRLDLDDHHARMAAERGIGLVISTDAHSIDGLNTLDRGVNQARRAGLEPRQIVNTLPWQELRRRIKRNRDAQ